MELKKLPNVFVQLALLVSLTPLSLKSQIANPAPYCASGFAINYNMVKDVNVNGTAYNLGPMGGAGPPSTLIYHNNLVFPNLSIGSTASFSIGFYSPQDLEPRYYTVWIDYNQNNTFDATELVMSNANTNNANLPTFAQPNVTLTVNFTIPANTAVGQTRMRVVRGPDFGNMYGTYNANYILPACNNSQVFGYGCTHDFNLNFINGAVPPVPPVPPVPVPRPVVQFMANVTATTVNSTVLLTDQSTNTPNAWKWTITPATYQYVNATGNTSQNPQVNFTTAGTYTVKLKATNAGGSDSLTKLSYITITSGGIRPIVQFAVSQTNTLVNGVVLFYDLSANNPTAWKWTITPSTYSLLNNTAVTSQNPQLKFTYPGIYAVKLRASNGAGSDSLTRLNYISVSLTGGNVSVSELNEAEAGIYMFPNPVKDYLNIRSENETIKSLNILDISGRVVSSPQLKNDKINMEELSPGAYVVLIRFNDGSEAYRKIIKE